MRLISLALAVFATAAFSYSVNSDDTLKRSAESSRFNGGDVFQLK